MSPEEFARLWGPATLTRLAPDHLDAPLLPDALRFLQTAGLPTSVTLDRGPGAYAVVTFGPLGRGMRTVRQQLDEEGADWPPPFGGDYVLVGREYYYVLPIPDVMAFIAVRTGADSVFRIDPGLDDPVSFVSSSIAQLAETLWLVRSSFETCQRENRAWATDARRLTERLAARDPAALSAPRAFWRALIDEVAQGRFLGLKVGDTAPVIELPIGGP